MGYLIQFKWYNTMFTLCWIVDSKLEIIFFVFIFCEKLLCQTFPPTVYAFNVFFCPSFYIFICHHLTAVISSFRISFFGSQYMAGKCENKKNEQIAWIPKWNSNWIRDEEWKKLGLLPMQIRKTWFFIHKIFIIWVSLPSKCSNREKNIKCENASYI